MAGHFEHDMCRSICISSKPHARRRKGSFDISGSGQGTQYERDVLLSHPDLQQVQVEDLMAFYLHASDQISRYAYARASLLATYLVCLRASRVSALAVRSAVTLGINMKSTSLTTPDISEEIRYRVWWCLYTFEHMLGITTGRATCISDGICTTPFPIPFEEDQFQDPEAAEILSNTRLRNDEINKVMASAGVRNMTLHPTGCKDATHKSPCKRGNLWVRNLPPNFGLCYLYYCDLAVAAQEVVNKVYSTDCVMVPWTHIDNRIGELRSRIDLWLRSIPASLDSRNRSTTALTGSVANLFSFSTSTVLASH